MKKIIEKLFLISFYKTFIFNFKYFGFRGLISYPILIGKHVELRNLGGSIILESFKPGNIRIGLNRLGNQYKNTPSIFSNKGNIFFKGSASIGIGSVISNCGNLILGDNFIVTAKTSICCEKEIIFGNDCLLSWDCQVLDSDFHKIYDKDEKILLNETNAIHIGNHCWICAGSYILKGVELANNIIVGANSTITHSCLESFCAISSNGIIKKNVIWEK